MIRKEFVATAYIIWEDKVLLLFHKKLGKWLPPGGHIEENETPIDAVRREVMEETGLEIEILSEENVVINEPNARSLPRPYLCLLEEIPLYKDVPAHQHIDSIYLARPVDDNPELSGSENIEMRWFTLEEAEALEDVFTETKETLAQIFTEHSSITT